MLNSAVIMVIAQVIWRWTFLRQMYFIREDFFNYDFKLDEHIDIIIEAKT
ncbi:MAG: hypothetical protein IH991_22040, partial [Planctomycetes bacterium]|nr:hypothetical protein [Planctomycetota bacterium]